MSTRAVLVAMTALLVACEGQQVLPGEFSPGNKGNLQLVLQDVCHGLEDLVVCGSTYEFGKSRLFIRVPLKSNSAHASCNTIRARIVDMQWSPGLVTADAGEQYFNKGGITLTCKHATNHFELSVVRNLAAKRDS